VWSGEIKSDVKRTSLPFSADNEGGRERGREAGERPGETKWASVI